MGSGKLHRFYDCFVRVDYDQDGHKVYSLADSHEDAVFSLTYTYRQIMWTEDGQVIDESELEIEELNILFGDLDNLSTISCKNSPEVEKRFKKLVEDHFDLIPDLEPYLV